MALGGCGDNRDCSTENSCTQYGNVNVGSETDEDEEETDEETGPKLWTLSQISTEQYFCDDDFYDLVDDSYSFCNCFVEKISIRWSYDDYKRHTWSYVRRLNDNGTLGRCTEPNITWAPETEEEIEEDQDFDPVADSTGSGPITEITPVDEAKKGKKDE
jgi:hypothetical protein